MWPLYGGGGRWRADGETGSLKTSGRFRPRLRRIAEFSKLEMRGRRSLIAKRISQDCTELRYLPSCCVNKYEDGFRFIHKSTDASVQPSKARPHRAPEGPLADRVLPGLDHRCLGHIGMWMCTIRVGLSHEAYSCSIMPKPYPKCPAPKTEHSAELMILQYSRGDGDDRIRPQTWNLVCESEGYLRWAARTF